MSAVSINTVTRTANLAYRYQYHIIITTKNITAFDRSATVRTTDDNEKKNHTNKTTIGKNYKKTITI